MKQLILLVGLLTSLVACQSNVKETTQLTQTKTTVMDTTTEKAAIEKLLLTYRDALNASDTNKAIALYTEDGVFMPTNAPTAKGQKQLKAGYDFVFSNIKLTIEFTIEEIEVSGDIAYAVTSSAGTTLVHATGETNPEANREIFALKKVGGDWKIARYMFNKPQ